MLHYNGFGVYCIISRMRAAKFHVYGLVTVGHSHYQPIVVALDVENYPAVL